MKRSVLSRPRARVGLLAGLLAAAFVLSAGEGEERNAMPPSATNTILWYTKPAQNWMTEALPIGNGSLGGMLFGDRKSVV
jgi:alpha-L-fucosidase 2